MLFDVEAYCDDDDDDKHGTDGESTLYASMCTALLSQLVRFFHTLWVVMLCYVSSTTTTPSNFNQTYNLHIYFYNHNSVTRKYSKRRGGLVTKISRIFISISMKKKIAREI
ncbi:unnamed protein product [Orchesella dallaii]|uniref:Uncharacterized protein n=1 Tax=Orchesella dallaii TaxID=48710 RepID=A0ABP1PKW3_9HEXA